MMNHQSNRTVIPQYPDPDRRCSRPSHSALPKGTFTALHINLHLGPVVLHHPQVAAVHHQIYRKCGINHQNMDGSFLLYQHSAPLFITFPLDFARQSGRASAYVHGESTGSTGYSSGRNATRTAPSTWLVWMVGQQRVSWLIIIFPIKHAIQQGYPFSDPENWGHHHQMFTARRKSAAALSAAREYKASCRMSKTSKGPPLRSCVSMDWFVFK